MDWAAPSRGKGTPRGEQRDVPMGGPQKAVGVLSRAPYDLILMKLEEIVAEASKLSEEERASLASQLLHGLESPVYEVSDDEVFRRRKESEDDPSVLITFDQLVAGLKRRGSTVP